MVVYKLAFLHDKHHHGGKNRSDQLLSWLKSTNPESEEWVKETCSHPILTAIYGIYFAFCWQKFQPIGIQSIRILGQDFFAAKRILKKHPELKKVFIEGTGFGATAIAKYFKAKGVKCYFMPCNLESLVPYGNLWSHKLAIGKRFAQEIKAMRYAEKVYAISFTEHWLLQMFGINSELLPYQPVGVMAERCTSIKLQRSHITSKCGLVYLANFKNGPNVKALHSFIEAYMEGEFKSTLPKESIQILGRGLDALKLKTVEGLDYIGEVSDEELEKYLAGCRAVILYHYPTSGTLTRLEEYKAMGIPIYANEMAVKHSRLVNQEGVTIL
jgi:hypothetical protein